MEQIIDGAKRLFAATQSKPKFVEELKSVRALQFEEVVFECRFGGNPNPSTTEFFLLYKSDGE